MFDNKYDVDDIAYYLNEINSLLKNENKDELVLPEDSIKGDQVNPIAENLQKIYHELLRRKDEEFDERMKKQRYERGYADIDVWNMYDWFLKTVKPMLMQYRKNHIGSPASLGENYKNEEGIWVNDKCHDEWNVILDRMIFLLNEMDEDTCSMVNPFQEDVEKAHDEFSEKYGVFGDGLKSGEEKEKEKTSGDIRIYFPTDEPGRDDVKQLFADYHNAENAIAEYRNRCKDEFFELFNKYFWDLWD